MSIFFNIIMFIHNTHFHANLVIIVCAQFCSNFKIKKNSIASLVLKVHGTVREIMNNLREKGNEAIYL